MDKGTRVSVEGQAGVVVEHHPREHASRTTVRLDDGRIVIVLTDEVEEED